jgi:hypothetical protein
LNAEWRKRLQEAFGERLTREVSMIWCAYCIIFYYFSQILSYNF